MSDQDSDSIMMPPPKKPRIEPEEYDTPKLEQSNIDFADDSLESNTEFSLNGSKYEDLVNPEEVERLKEFQVLDEVKSNDEDSDEESESSDGKSEGLPEDEIERMLDEDLPDSFKEAPKPKEKPYVTRQKIILEEKGINHFEVLPLDWMMVRHYSGMPVYMHRASRVCTLSKPYLLGKGNTRRHDIPISAIPCLNYRRALEEEAKQKEIDRRIAEQIQNGTWKKSNTTVSNDKPNGQNTHKEASLKTNDNIAPGDNGETNQSISECLNTEITKTSDTFEKTTVSNVELNHYIALLDDRHDVEIISNLESRQKNGTEEIPPEQQNGIDHSEEIDLTRSALFNNTDRGKSRCPFIHKQKEQDSQECPISNSNVEDQTESSVECKTREKEEKCREDQSSPKTTVGSEQNGPENEEVLIKAENESPKPEGNGTELTPSGQNPEENPDQETMENREQEIVENREQEIVGNREQETVEHREQEIVENREQEIVENRDQETMENREQETVEHREKEKEIVENREQEIVGNREQETVEHREQEIVQNREQEIVGNREQVTVEHREQETVGNREQETVGNREQETLDNREQETPLSAQPVVLPGGIVMPPPRVETVSTSWKTQQLSYEQVNEYCRKLFQFKTVQIMHFKRWADRRKYARARKTLQYPTLPSGTKLITIPAQAQANSGGATEHIGGLLGAVAGKSNKRDWVMNMNGRSYLSVFHEYVRRALQKQPAYEFKQLENAATPYQATVYIGGMQYGVGRGTSKRLAKANAARASIQILIPEMKDDGPAPEAGEPDFSFFDYVGIEDPRITEFCAATCEPSPHATLRTCLLRNFGTGERHIHTEMKKLEYQKIELTMKVGKHSATVVCKNKKTAKQRASQAILQALHPHVRSWGSLLRLYGSRSVKSCKEKKLEEQQITLLQDQARHNEPNYAVLDKLRLEMKRLGERDAAVVPIGTLVLKDDLPSHSGSNLNNVDL